MTSTSIEFNVRGSLSSGYTVFMYYTNTDGELKTSYLLRKGEVVKFQSVEGAEGAAQRHLSGKSLKYCPHPDFK